MQGDKSTFSLRLGGVLDMLCVSFFSLNLCVCGLHTASTASAIENVFDVLQLLILEKILKNQIVGETKGPFSAYLTPQPICVFVCLCVRVRACVCT